MTFALIASLCVGAAAGLLAVLAHALTPAPPLSQVVTTLLPALRRMADIDTPFAEAWRSARRSVIETLRTVLRGLPAAGSATLAFLAVWGIASHALTLQLWPQGVMGLCLGAGVASLAVARHPRLPRRPAPPPTA